MVYLGHIGNVEPRVDKVNVQVDDQREMALTFSGHDSEKIVFLLGDQILVFYEKCILPKVTKFTLTVLE